MADTQLSDAEYLHYEGYDNAWDEWVDNTHITDRQAVSRTIGKGDASLKHHARPLFSNDAPVAEQVQVGGLTAGYASIKPR